MAIEVSTPERRLTFARAEEIMPLPNLIQMQADAFKWFQEEGLRDLFEEISPITDFAGKMSLEFIVPEKPFGEPKYTEHECRERDMTYSAPLTVRAKLRKNVTAEGEPLGEIIEQEIFMGDFPLMTEQGTFVINGAERVVVSQLVRSPGVYYTADTDPASGRDLYMAKLIPNRGAWLEFETSNKDVLTVKVDRKRKIPVTTLLRAVGYGTNEQIMDLFKSVDTDPDHHYIESTLERDNTEDEKSGLIEMYKKLRPGDPPTLENARSLINSLFFNERRYDLGRVGRYKLNKRLHVDEERGPMILTKEDLARIVAEQIRCNNNPGRHDDIDHLGNRRVRAVGELLQQQFRVGLLRMERVVKERMTIQDVENARPNALINIRPVVAAMKEFFGGSQLSQFMDQTNPLSELTHKRRLSALGPGGLSRERAGFDVRDVHPSHYGRICPIETPEGPNIGLIGNLATYARTNPYGFIETPYRKVFHSLPADSPELPGRVLRADVPGKSGRAIAKAGTTVDSALIKKFKTNLPEGAEVPIRPFVSHQIDYMTADEEEEFTIAQANVQLQPDGSFVQDRVSVRHQDQFLIETIDHVHYMDVSTRQLVSLATAMIPFLEHDDANRALMGANMQRQAVPLLVPEAPLVGTGTEGRAAYDSGHLVIADADGEVLSVTGREIVVRDSNGATPKDGKGETNGHVQVGLTGVARSHSVVEGDTRRYKLRKFIRSNQGTLINQRPAVQKGQLVKRGDVLADGSSTSEGELALGQNVLVAFMVWEGGNYEDAILLSDRMVEQDKFTSIHMEKHEVDARDTKLGPEEITRDIPNVGEEGLRNLDERGIIYIGAEVGPNDILVGKITPKGETELTAEERLLRAIFGEKAREVKDTSLRVPQGERGKVVDVRVFSRENGDELPPGVNELVRVSIAQKRKVSEGDKMAGRHGNKGVISRIVPKEDMPFLADGTPVDIVLNPLGVPSRMNIGQVLETHLGWAAEELGYKVATPVFDGATEQQIVDQLSEASLPGTGQTILFDGRSGEPFDQPVTVGQIYMLKLAHLVEDKIHARSTGPYSLVTQQPLGGKAQFGGQRFGEMEVWALEAYGAAHILQELLTVKSDDVIGRVKTYEAIVKGEPILEPGVPESFKVLVKELQSLALSVEVLNEDDERVAVADEAGLAEIPDLDINITGFERGDF
ncbi:MAG TPA: DNA-directed RNA polymerase subunit beta [Chloroflexota bacterium]|nr:DNA-directed RNA polymerase subunit beta [Chloroflexota bacterium]